MTRPGTEPAAKEASLPGDDRAEWLSEDILDAAIEYTFPASDPISVTSAYRARERGGPGDARGPAGRSGR